MRNFILISYLLFASLIVFNFGSFQAAQADNPPVKSLKGVDAVLPGNLPKLDVAEETDPVKLVETVLLKYVINPIFLISAGVAIIVIMYSAFRIIVARGEEEGITAAKNALIWAAAGLALVVMAYTIVNNLARIIIERI